MIITLIHGDDIAASRMELEKLISDKKFPTKIDGSKILLEDLTSALEVRELFQDKRTVIIENLLKGKGRGLSKFIDFLNNFKDEFTEMILWEQETVNKKIVLTLKSLKEYKFELPKYYYQFLDGIYPGNAKKAVELMHKVYPQVSDEQIFYSIVKRIRILLSIKCNNESRFEETQKMATWQIGKLKNQARFWNNDLTAFYEKLYDIEKSLKTSQIPIALINRLDILMLSELN